MRVESAISTLQHCHWNPPLGVRLIRFESREASDRERPAFIALGALRKLARLDPPAVSTDLRVAASCRHEVLEPVWRSRNTGGGPNDDQVITTGHVDQHDGMRLSTPASDDVQQEARISEDLVSLPTVARPVFLHLTPAGC